MTPTFNPGPNPFGPPPIYVGALPIRLTRATAEVADGLLVMPFGSREVLREHHAAACATGWRRPGGPSPGSRSCPRSSLSAGEDHDAARRLLAFLRFHRPTARCSTIQRLGRSAARAERDVPKQSCWQEMAGLITDDVLHTIAACGTRSRSPSIRQRVDGISDTVCLYQPGPIATEVLGEIVDELRRRAESELR